MTSTKPSNFIWSLGFTSLFLSLCLSAQIAKDGKNSLDIAQTIPGRAGIDYPILSKIPNDFEFDCRDHDYAGYFADVKYDCQVYHVCFPDNRNSTFLCGNGTIFNQRNYVCDWWHRFNCSHAPSLYELNLFKKPPLPVIGPPTYRVQPTLVRIPKASLDIRNIPKLTVPSLNKNREPIINANGYRSGSGPTKPSTLSRKDQESKKPINRGLNDKNSETKPKNLVPDKVQKQNPVLLVTGRPRARGNKTLSPVRPNRSSQAKNGRQVFFQTCNCSTKN